MLGLVVAARYLTIVPVGRARWVDSQALGRAAPWFAVVGAAIGAVLALVDALAGAVFPGLLVALLVVTAWKLLTGGLHLDGLADCLDGLAGHDREHRLEIMRDSRIGAFGAMGLILFLLLEIAAVAELPASVRSRTLVVAPAVARAMPGLLACLFPPARPDGQGARFHAGVGRGGALAGLALAAAAAVGLLGAAGAVVLVAVCAVALAAGAFMARRLGGVTGDVFGAAVELTEVAALLTVLAWTAAPR